MNNILKINILFEDMWCFGFAVLPSRAFNMFSVVLARPPASCCSFARRSPTGPDSPPDPLGGITFLRLSSCFCKDNRSYKHICVLVSSKPGFSITESYTSNVLLKGHNVFFLTINISRHCNVSAYFNWPL